MRLSCPSCNQSFSAKSSSRNLKCPKCGHREPAPEGGWESMPGWRKGKVGGFERLDMPAHSPKSSRMMTYGAVGLVVLVAAAAGFWWFGPASDGGASGQGSCPNVANASPVAPGPVELDLITPGVWNVCADSESMFVWVHNNGTAPLDYTWSISGVGGQPLPEGWSVTFSQPSGTLRPGGSQGPDWASTQVSLTLPATHPGGEVQAELHAGGATRQFTFHVAPERGTVIAAGTPVMTHYDLKDAHGNRIQEGDYCLTAGGGQAVKAYSFGVIGMALNETVTLVVPPAFAYGYSGANLSGQWLHWTTTATSLPGSC